MTALWMLYALALAALAGGAAACVDAMLRATRRATRGVWLAALAASLAAPVAAWLAAHHAASTPTAAGVESGEPMDGSAVAALLARAHVHESLPADAAERWRALDHPLLAAWLAASLLSIGWLALSYRRLGAAARRWQPATVAGEPVLVSRGMGPAAVAGSRGGRIVLPAWALDLAGDRLTLLLAHERSHLEARDPQLLAAATAAVALAPWNPALWWQLRRLRLAVEIDCDRRVLRRHPDVAAYGTLLLDVARRGGAGGLPLGTALAAPTPSTALERRIRTMTSRRPRLVAVRMLALGALGAGLVAAACEAPHPTAPRPTASVPLAALSKAAPEMASADGGPTIDMVRQAIAERLPSVASGATPARRAWFLVDATGRVVDAASDAGGGAGQTLMRGGTLRVSIDSQRVLEAHDAATTEPGGGPEWMRTLDPSSIHSVDVLKLGPGRVSRDSLGVIWIRLRAPGETAKVPNGARARTRLTAPAARSSAVRADTVPVARTLLADSTRPAPIFFVDGRRVPLLPSGKPDLGGLTNDQIDSVEILKGAAAIAAYGPDAANGVVVIKTKKGSSGER